MLAFLHRFRFMSAVLSIALILVSGCGSSKLSDPALTKTLSSISVTPANTSISVNGTQQFTATGLYSDGSTANVTPSVTWASSNSGVATVAASGIGTGVSVGSTSITATMGGVSGSTALTVTALMLTSITVTPANPSFANGSTQQFIATANYSNGSTAIVTSSVTWTSSNSSVATISSSGLATGQGGGTTTISATQGGLMGSTTASVTLNGNVSITTWHVDTNRSGLNNQRTTLTPANVAPATFGKLFSCLVDGYVYGSPLILSNQTINGATA